MKHVALGAFAITACVLVPTTLHVLEAGPNQVAKLVAPDEQSIQVGDARVDVSVDRSLVDAGAKVHVTLTATADKPVKVPLAVLVYESEGVPEERVEDPPRRIGRDAVTLDVVDGKATRTFAFTLPGARITRTAVTEYRHYTVLVMSPKAANQLEAKRRRADNNMADSSGFFEIYRGLGEDVGSDTPADAARAIARLDVTTRAHSDHLEIVAADAARVGDVAVKVRVRNKTRRAFAQVDVGLAAESAELGGQWRGIPADQVVIADSPDSTFALAARETKDVVFHVHTKATGTLGLYATVRCNGDDCDDHNAKGDASALDDSVLDAIDILPADESGSASATVAATAPPAPAK
jgi:hypothetical protein